MPDFRRGADAIAEAQAKAKANAGNFKPFTPTLFVTEGTDNARYFQFLNEMVDIPTVDMITYIPQEGKKANGDKFTYYESVIARTDPAIGEDVDPMEKEWDANPRETCVAVAVELEPVFETVKGRQRPRGFEVKTTTFERRVRDDEGELTDESEEVEAPVVGFVQQSPHNFFNLVSSYDSGTAPIEDTPVKITRVDSKTYQVEGYPDQEVDLTPLVDLVGELSYLGDDRDELLEALDEIEDDHEAALAIGAFLLDKRLEELADAERYDQLLQGITEPFKFGKKGKNSSKKSDKPKRERPSRRSQRRSADPEPEAEAEETPEPEAEPEEEKPKRRARRAPAAKKESTREKASGEAHEKLERLRQRGTRKATAAAA